MLFPYRNFNNIWQVRNSFNSSPTMEDANVRALHPWGIFGGRSLSIHSPFFVNRLSTRLDGFAPCLSRCPPPPFTDSPQFWLTLQSNKSTMIGKVILLLFAIAGRVSALWPKGAQECVYRPPGAKMWVSTAEQVTISNNGCIKHQWWEITMNSYKECEFPLT